MRLESNEISFMQCEPGMAGSCWLNSAAKRGWIALWPKKLRPERVQLKSRWDFYVEWSDETRGHVNSVLVCPRHTDLLNKRWAEDAVDDINVELATEQWANMNGGRL